MIKANGLALCLAAAGLAFAVTATSAATYNGDLIIGFTAQIGNDREYDMGSGLTLTNGQSWDLSSILTNLDLSTVKWGVIGDTVSGTPHTVWATKAGAAAPGLVNGNAAWSAINIPTAGMYNLFPTAGAGQSIAPSSSLTTSWNQYTVVGGTGTYKNAYINPNTTGITNVNFWKTITDNSAPVILGTFSLAANGVVTFNTNSVVTPPPTPPVPQVLFVTWTNGTSTVYFTTTNNAAFTYKLYYTNSAGLNTPVSNWAVSATSVVGNGLTNSITDTTTDLNRFYRVGVH